MIERKNFDETAFALISILNDFMQTDEVSGDDKRLIKVNRFKKWVISTVNETLDNMTE